MRATFTYTLPDDQSEFDAARLGRQALTCLWDIDAHCRSLLKYGAPTPEQAALAEEIRALIAAELLDA